MSFRFGIVGAGAMGSLFGGILAAAGADVALLDIDEAHVGAIRAAGLRIDRGEGTQTVPVAATTDAADIGPVDVLILFCKHLSTDAALTGARPMIGDRTVVWTLQNGIGNVDIILGHVPADRVAKGFTSATGTLDGPGRVSTNFRGRTETWYGPLVAGENGILAEAARILTDAGLLTAEAPDIDYRIWRKLVINTSLTALAGAMNTRIGAVYFEPAGRRLCEAVVREVVQVANASGVALTLDDALGYLDQLAHSAVEHIGSMTVSLQRKEHTEVDAINGAVVREGERHGIPTPFNRAVTDFVHLIEETAAVRLSPGI